MKVSEEQLEQLNRAFRRIFALPISGMTIRELQNAINLSMPSDGEATKALYESLLTGELKENLKKGANATDLANLVDDFAFQFRIAREVAESGEFMNIFSCDFAQQGNNIYFVNRMRRIDGQEYHFLSAPETNVRLAHMFINRLTDLKKAIDKKSGSAPLTPHIKEELTTLKNDIEALLA